MRLNDQERLASGRAIGSGVVEGWTKTLGLRLKARGARWNPSNVRPMAILVCVPHSVQSEAYWALAACLPRESGCTRLSRRGNRLASRKVAWYPPTLFEGAGGVARRPVDRPNHGAGDDS
ncbi:MAG: hypothetical protein ACRC1K_15265 [Planctomycetia bacterium]